MASGGPAVEHLLETIDEGDIQLGHGRRRDPFRCGAGSLAAMGPCRMRRGADQNRTGVRGFAGLCLATRPRRRDRPWYPGLVAGKLRGRTGRSVRFERLEAEVTAWRDDGGSAIDVARSLVDRKCLHRNVEREAVDRLVQCVIAVR